MKQATPVRRPPEADRFERSWLAVVMGVTAILAVAGAIAVAVGTLELGPGVLSGLVWHSGPLVGLVLAVVVGLPMTVAMVLTVRDDCRHGPAAVLAGVLLVGWIGVEVAVVRGVGWSQVFFVAVGLAVVIIGRHRMTVRRR
jgi:hypothetical protein